MDYYSHAPDTTAILERLAREQPTTLACMHGSAFRGDGAALLRALAQSLSARPQCERRRKRRSGCERPPFSETGSRP